MSLAVTSPATRRLLAYAGGALVLQLLKLGVLLRQPGDLLALSASNSSLSLPLFGDMHA